MKRLLIVLLVLTFNWAAQALNESDETSEGLDSTEESRPSAPTEAPAAVAPAPVVSSPAPTTSSTAPGPEPKESLSAFSVGVQGGQSRTNITEPGFLNKSNFSVGGNIELHFVENWSLQVEANYVSKGYRGIDGLFQNEATLNYLEFPLFIKMRLPWNILAPNLFVGPSVAYLHSSKITQSGIVTDTTSSTNRLEYSFYVGAGLDLLISEKIVLGASARYGWGLSDINSGSFQADVFNRTLQLMAGAQFRL